MPGAVTTDPLGINNRGQVVGAHVDPDGVIHGFLWARTASPRSTRLAQSARHHDINDRGEIVGSAFEAGDVVRAFLLRDGVYTTFEVPGAPFTFLEDINERGQIAGTTYTDNVTLSGARGFLLAKASTAP